MKQSPTNTYASNSSTRRRMKGVLERGKMTTSSPGAVSPYHVVLHSHWGQAPEIETACRILTCEAELLLRYLAFDERDPKSTPAGS
jgi:hypothetical protein